MKSTPAFLRSCLAACFLLLGAAEGRAGAPAPNILFIFSDDQRADTIHALGNSHITTPNLDTLVQRGTAFDRAFYMGGMQPAVCAPSRAMLMTGRTLFHVDDALRKQQTWPEMFGQQGYETFATGKWHNGVESLLRSFAEGQALFLGGMGDPYTIPLQSIGADHRLADGPHEKGRHAVELIGDAAVHFIESRKMDRPFLLYAAMDTPHDPRIAPPEYHAPYDADKPPLPANFLPRHPFDNGEMTVRDEKLAPWPRTPEIVRQQLADYYACITFMDAQIGRILTALRQTGQEENTLIVFSSDQGLAIGSHGLMGKQNLYEDSVRVPLILAGPGISQAARNAAFCYLSDVFPTLGAIAGVKAPEGSEGVSLVSAMQGGKQPHDAIFSAYRGVQRAVRDERWKLIRYPEVNRTQLFELQSDPDEKNDLAGDPGHAAEVQRMTTLLQDWQRKLDDHLPLRLDQPPLSP